MPEIGIKTAAQILLSIGDGSDFASSGHLAAYAGIAPVTQNQAHQHQLMSPITMPKPTPPKSFT